MDVEAWNNAGRKRKYIDAKNGGSIMFSMVCGSIISILILVSSVYKVTVTVSYVEPVIDSPSTDSYGLQSTSMIWIQDRHDPVEIVTPASSLKGGGEIIKKIVLHPVKSCQKSKLSVYAYATDTDGYRSNSQLILEEFIHTCPTPGLQASNKQL